MTFVISKLISSLDRPRDKQIYLHYRLVDKYDHPMPSNHIYISLHSIHLLSKLARLLNSVRSSNGTRYSKITLGIIEARCKFRNTSGSRVHLTGINVTFLSADLGRLGIDEPVDFDKNMSKKSSIPPRVVARELGPILLIMSPYGVTNTNSSFIGD